MSEGTLRRLRSLVTALQFRPKLVDCFREGYTRDDLRADLLAGVTVGVVALPLAMAFAIASGVSPQSGIFTAIIAGFLISLLGGSRVQIGGPTGAYIVIVYGIVAQYGIANLAICTVAAGVLLFAMGALRLGSLIRFIPVAIVIGFTNGIAILILLSQVKDFLGLDLTLPEEFFTRVQALATNVPKADPVTVLLAVACLIALLFWPKEITTSGRVLEAESEHAALVTEGGRDKSLPERALHDTLRRVQRVLTHLPGPIMVLVIASLVVGVFHLDVQTIGTRFGGIPQELPAFAWPEISLPTLRNLLAPTITIALLGAIESLLSARVADAMIDDRHDPNQELMGQGVANVVAPLFGGIPATGAIARTATSVRTGARSPIAGIVHALTLLVIILAAAPLAKYIPLAALSAVLVVVSLNMGDWHAFRDLRKYSIAYRTVLLATFAVTVVFDLSLAVQIGLVLASLFFIYRISELTRVEPITLDGAPPGVAAYKVFGSLFFGSIGKLEPLLDPVLSPAQIMILEMHQVISIDNTGLETLQALQRTLAKRGGQLILCGLNRHPSEQVARSGFREELGVDNIVPHLASALFRAHKLAPQNTAPDFFETPDPTL
ncbi:MAG: STAS domain-containing protein [Burkholderiales bacterium]|nr:STAS domain-containing protein [Burkholderiales bacterium]